MTGCLWVNLNTVLVTDSCHSPLIILGSHRFYVDIAHDSLHTTWLLRHRKKENVSYDGLGLDKDWRVFYQLICLLINTSLLPNVCDDLTLKGFYVPGRPRHTDLSPIVNDKVK